MKENLTFALGKWLMEKGNFRIVIVDDEDVYFGPKLLAIAKHAGYGAIERYSKVDADLHKKLCNRPPQILILDVKNVVDPDIATDGLELSEHLAQVTPSFIAVTSAHRYHLNNRVTKVDYIIESRVLTGVEFVAELRNMTEKCLSTKIRFYSKIAFRVGFAAAKKSLVGIK